MVHVPEDTEVKDLPFPHARIVDMVREETAEGQYVRKRVYFGLNLLLGRIADEIIDKLVDTDHAYIEKADLDRAARKYERIEEILEEKDRIIKHLQALEADVEQLSRDMERAGD